MCFPAENASCRKHVFSSFLFDHNTVSWKERHCEILNCHMYETFWYKNSAIISAKFGSPTPPSQNLLHRFCVNFLSQKPEDHPNFRKKCFRSEKAILGALGVFRGILGAALGVQKLILGMRDSILGIASHDLPIGRMAKLGRFGSFAFAMKNRHFGSWRARKRGKFWVFACVPNPGKQSIWWQCPPSARKQSTNKLQNRPGFTHV